MTRQDRIASFLARATRSLFGCWEWKGRTDRYGYGLSWESSALTGVSRRGRRTGAHRVAWMLFRGPIPNGLWVLHRCDNRRCVRPDHLFLGTVQDNNADRKAKGRAPRGEERPDSKLTESDIREIRALNSHGVGYKRLAKQFCVSPRSIGNIVHRRKWAHVETAMEVR